MSKPKKKQYFTEETEDAIIEYVSCQDDKKRNQVWDEKIKYPFHKLTENIIQTFKFAEYMDGNTVSELQHEVTVFLLEKLDKYKKNKGKAFSYFGTVAKRWLITNHEKNYKKLLSRSNIEDIQEDKIISNDIQYQIDNDNSSFLNSYIIYVEKNVNKFFPIDKDLIIANAIMELFKKRSSLEILNKKALYIYIKEITNTAAPQITKIIKKLKEVYAAKFNEYYRDGYITS